MRPKTRKGQREGSWLKKHKERPICAKPCKAQPINRIDTDLEPKRTSGEKRPETIKRQGESRGAWTSHRRSEAKGQSNKMARSLTNKRQHEHGNQSRQARGERKVRARTWQSLCERRWKSKRRRIGAAEQKVHSTLSRCDVHDEHDNCKSQSKSFGETARPTDLPPKIYSRTRTGQKKPQDAAVREEPQTLGRFEEMKQQAKAAVQERHRKHTTTETKDQQGSPAIRHEEPKPPEIGGNTGNVKNGDRDIS